jgi:hypothetical protein
MKLPAYSNLLRVDSKKTMSKLQVCYDMTKNSISKYLNIRYTFDEFFSEFGVHF